MNHTRHIGIFNAGTFSATLIGAGGIGAMTALVLAKMGVGRLIIYDEDKVDEFNLPVQFHKLSDVGKPKVITIQRAIKEYADGIAVEHRYLRVTEDTILEPTYIVISAVDSIKSRKQIWQAVKHRTPMWYLDARMSAEHFQMFAVDMDDFKWYDDSLAGQDDSQIPNEPCTSKATIYTGCMAAGHVGAALRRIITSQQESGILSHDIFKNTMSCLSMQS